MTKMEPIIHYKGSFDDFDTEHKGYRNDVFVELPNGDLFEVFFYDPIRLTNDLGTGTYVSQPGLIVLNSVNKASIKEAIIDLYKRKFFDYFKPISTMLNNHFDENI